MSHRLALRGLTHDQGARSYERVSQGAGRGVPDTRHSQAPSIRGGRRSLAGWPGSLRTKGIGQARPVEGVAQAAVALAEGTPTLGRARARGRVAASHCE